ncbi:MAG: DNA polymerase IV [Candidatus Heimdallarchaeota archaeon]|nr:DNA polymerase IV [Candidatus Heimdallarchaeota archaeon]MCK4769023.1 DNA polymerase IV [Candidatus Heimdallarchaeota archaeon]
MALVNQTAYFSEKEQSFDSIILYMDLDAFFASVEIRENPSLVGKPLIVGGNPKTKRGVVSTCSYEARKYGIHSGMPVSQAVKLCPHVLMVRGTFSLYTKVSNNIMGILKHYSNVMKVAGNDEAYLDLTDVVSDYEEARKLAMELKDDIYASEHLTCSVGIAPNKILAKIASETDKPDGLVVMKPLEIAETLAPLDITAIPGVGKKSKEVFIRNGVYTCGDLAKIPFQLVYQKFGKYGLKTWKLVNGYNTEKTDEKFVSRERKSISEERTFFHTYSSWKDIWVTLDSAIQTIVTKAKEKKMNFRTVTLKIRFQNFETFTRSYSLQCYANSEKHVREVVTLLLEEFSDRVPNNIRLVGVKISNLIKIDDNQKTLTQFFNKTD